MHSWVEHMIPAKLSDEQHSREQAAAQKQLHGEAPATSAACEGICHVSCHVSLLPCILVLACLVLHMQ